MDILPELAEQFEEPFADSSALVTYLVSRLAKQYVKVILNGDGGDENFTGYSHHLKLQRDYLLSPLAKYFPVGKYLKVFTLVYWKNIWNIKLILILRIQKMFTETPTKTPKRQISETKYCPPILNIICRMIYLSK